MFFEDFRFIFYKNILLVLSYLQKYIFLELEGIDIIQYSLVYFMKKIKVLKLLNYLIEDIQLINIDLILSLIFF